MSYSSSAYDSDSFGSELEENMEQELYTVMKRTGDEKIKNYIRDALWLKDERLMKEAYDYISRHQQDDALNTLEELQGQLRYYLYRTNNEELREVIRDALSLNNPTVMKRVVRELPVIQISFEEKQNNIPPLTKFFTQIPLDIASELDAILVGAKRHPFCAFLSNLNTEFLFGGKTLEVEEEKSLRQNNVKLIEYVTSAIEEKTAKYAPILLHAFLKAMRNYTLNEEMKLNPQIYRLFEQITGRRELQESSSLDIFHQRVQDESFTDLLNKSNSFPLYYYEYMDIQWLMEQIVRFWKLSKQPPVVAFRSKRSMDLTSLQEKLANYKNTPHLYTGMVMAFFRFAQKDILKMLQELENIDKQWVEDVLLLKKYLFLCHLIQTETLTDVLNTLLTSYKLEFTDNEFYVKRESSPFITRKDVMCIVQVLVEKYNEYTYM